MTHIQIDKAKENHGQIHIVHTLKSADVVELSFLFGTTHWRPSCELHRSAGELPERGSALTLNCVTKSKYMKC